LYFIFSKLANASHLLAYADDYKVTTPNNQ
jgi:hypothetical protein